VSDKPSFFAELKRRNVYKVAVAYAIVGWLLIQVATSTFPILEIPNWTIKLVIALVLLGFPIALILAWAFELTPEGIKRAEDVLPNESITPRTGRKLVGITIVLAVIAASLLAFQFSRVGTPLRGVQSAPEAGGRRPGGASLPEKSIAVLPFESLSEEKSNAYFAEGIQDEILTRLAKVADLKVIARTSTQKFRSAPENLPDIAQQLGAANILEGSVQKVNDQVRVNVQLINARTNAHLWAEIYDRKLTDIFSVESDIAKTIADTLQVKLTGSEKNALSSRPTEDQEAYQLYLQGRFFWNKRTAPDLRRSVDLFKEAIAKDPNYALAYAGMAQAWLLIPAYDGGAPRDCFPQAQAAAEKALALDSSLSDAYTALGAIKATYTLDWAGSIADFERAIHLNPNDATAHHWLGNHPLTCLGQIERALAEVRRARELDPLSLVINTNIGYTHMMARRYDEAITQLRKTVEMDNNFYYARYTLGESLELKGVTDEAIAEYQKASAISNDLAPLGYLGHVYGKLGRREEAQRILNQLLETRKERYTEAYFTALVYLGLGNRDEALHYLELSYQDRDGYNIGPIRVDSFLNELRGDPRFEALAEKVVSVREFGSGVTAAK
jgi:TolB-like protein/Tfp pilus assembly protein PilF